MEVQEAQSAEEKNTSDVQIAIRYGLPYLVFCAVLSHIAYWSTFNIRVFEFLDFGDLVTSFLYPVFFNSVILILTPVIAVSFFRKGSFWSWALMSVTVGILELVVLFVTNSDYTGSVFGRVIYSAFILFPLILAIPIFSKKVYNIPGLNSGVRLPTIVLLCYFPIASFSISKFNAMAIRNNWEYKVVLNEEGKEGQYKYLGKVGGVFFFSTIDNSELMFVNESDFKRIRLKHVEIELPPIPAGGNPSTPPPRPPGGG